MGKTLYSLKDNLISFPNIDLASSNTPETSSYRPKHDGGGGTINQHSANSVIWSYR